MWKPPSGLFAYSPDVAAYVATETAGVIDLSRDIISFTIVRRVNAISELSLVVNNKHNRYDRTIGRMSRIVVFLKRVRWLQAFSGYVTEAPYMTVVPDTATIRAECTLKRLAHSYWDPYAPESIATFYPVSQSDMGFSQRDGGAAASMFRLLTLVAQWDPKKIWIEKLPRPFTKQLAEIVVRRREAVASDPDIQAVLDVFEGVTDAEGYTPPDGEFGPEDAKWVRAQQENQKNPAVIRQTVMDAAYWALDQRVPYVFGAMDPKKGFDCSGLTKWCYAKAGIDLPHQAQAQYDMPQMTKFQERKKAQPGDFVFYHYPNDRGVYISHVGIYAGNGQLIDASSANDSVVKRNIDWSAFVSFGNVIGDTGRKFKYDASGSTEGSGAAVFPVGTIPSYSDESLLLSGDRRWLNDVPVMETVQQFAAASLRSFQSAPNGDFVAWFPDKFGMYKQTNPALKVRDVEVVDFSVSIRDTFATHVGVAANTIDILQTSAVDIVDWLTSIGIITVRDTDIMKLMMGLAPTRSYQDLGQWLLYRFGMRKIREAAPHIRSPLWEFLYAYQLFMEYWTQQFIASPQLTFMPEAYPGMRMELADRGIAFYIESVVHRGSRESGFFTDITASTPMERRGDRWVLMPVEHAPEEMEDQMDDLQEARRSGS